MGASPPPAPRFARPVTLRVPSHPASPSYGRPSADAFVFLGNRGNVGIHPKRQQQADRKTRRLRRRECSPGGASGFGSAQSSTFAPADSDLKGRRPRNRPFASRDQAACRGVAPGRAALPCPSGISSSWPDHRRAPDMPPRSFRPDRATMPRQCPPVMFCRSPAPRSSIGAGDALNIARPSVENRPTIIKQCLCFRAFLLVGNSLFDGEMVAAPPCTIK